MRLTLLWAALALCAAGAGLRAQTPDLSPAPAPTAPAPPVAAPPAPTEPFPPLTPPPVDPAATPSVAPNCGGGRRRAAASNAAAQADQELVNRSRQGPIDISARGETTFASTPRGRLAIAVDGVSIVTDDASIYCDRAEYNVDTHEADLTGNVRIYRLDTSLLANHAIYNFDTKAIRALDFDGSRPPFSFGGVSLFSPGAGSQYNINRGTFTTDDSTTPDYHLNARRVRVYPDNRVVYIGTTLYIGTTPVFYFPYFYQSLDQQSGYTVTPGYTSVFGAYILTGITFPITQQVTGLARVDYRSSRGIGLGLNIEYKPNRKVRTPPSSTGLPAYASDDNPAEAATVTSPRTGQNTSVTASRANSGSDGGLDDSDDSDDGTGTGNRRSGFARTGEALSRQTRSRAGLQLATYYLHDDKPDLNRTSLDRLPVDQDRYRIKFAGTQFITDDLFFKVDVEKLSDRYLLQDFYEGEFTRNPNPENLALLAYYRPTFVTTLTARAQLNSFFNATERLPEVSLDVPRLPLFNSGLYYDSENSAGYFQRTFDNRSPLPEYRAFRFDSFHQLTYPNTYFGWLSVVPRLGFRATYYSRSSPANDGAYDLQNVGDDTSARSLFTAGDPTNLDFLTLRNSIRAFRPRAALIRPVANVGLEASFKVSKVYGDAENRAFGVDQLRHIIQPYINLTDIETFGTGSRDLLQFDRRLPSTQLQPIDFPQQTTIDSIDNESVARIGIRNRLQTKRDALTFNWLDIDTFFQVGNDPNQRSNVSNVFNQVSFRPLPWVTFSLDSQLPIFNGTRGFTEVDTSLQIQATRNLDLTVSHRYLNDNPFFVNSSLLRFNVYYRIDDNWAASFSERYEFATSTLQAQSYTIYRDLTSFVGSLGLTVRDNNGVSDYGVVLNFTLKGIPKVSLPVGFDVNAVENQVAQ